MQKAFSRYWMEQLESRTLLSVPEPNNTLATAHIIFGGKPFAGTNTFTEFVGSTDTIDIYKCLPTRPAI